jgi:arsenate reductase-like glutaredoxin family protein
LIAKNQLTQIEAQESEASIDNMITKPTSSRKPFLISTKNEKALTQSFQNKSWAALLGFFTIGAMAVWMFNVRF